MLIESSEGKERTTAELVDNRSSARRISFVVAPQRKPVASLPRAFDAALAKVGSIDQAGDCGAEVRLRRVPELHDQRMFLERLLDDAALNALAASVDQPHFAEPGFVRGTDVLLDDGCDVARRERVKVERVFDRDLVQDGYVAVTTVFIPPRTAKSPTTVMRRG